MASTVETAPRRTVNLQFASPTGLGRISLASFALGVLWSSHLCLGGYALQQWLVHHRDMLWLCQWCAYVVALSVFHFSEFISTALWKPESLSYDSFVINHSKEYTIAAVTSWVEFWLEYLFFPQYKGTPEVIASGIVVVFVGQTIRTMAMWTAKSNFSHKIESRKRREHVLVTHGIYRVLRHPSYFGWFWWSVGTQLLLGNPICFVGYSVASWNFFRQRIPFEEELLVKFFGDEYVQYKRRTITGIPGI